MLKLTLNVLFAVGVALSIIALQFIGAEYQWCINEAITDTAVEYCANQFPNIYGE